MFVEMVGQISVDTGLSFIPPAHSESLTALKMSIRDIFLGVAHHVFPRHNQFLH